MRVLFSGSPDLADMIVVAKAVKESGFRVTEIIEAGRVTIVRNPPLGSRVTLGTDYLARLYGYANGIEVSEFTFKRSLAGYFLGQSRDRQMLKYAEALLAISSDNRTLRLVNEARKLGLPVFDATNAK